MHFFLFVCNFQFRGTDYFTIPVVGEGNVAVAKTLDFEVMYMSVGSRADLCVFDMIVTATVSSQICQVST